MSCSTDRKIVMLLEFYNAHSTTHIRIYYYCIKNLLQCISSATYSLSRNMTGINSLSCVAECNCNTSQYEPVCGADGITYASPCNAGCTARNLTDPDVSESSL